MRSQAMSIIQKTFINEYIKCSQLKCPTLGTKFCIESLGNAPPISVLGKGLTLKGAFLIVMDIFTVIGDLAVYFICLICI